MSDRQQPALQVTDLVRTFATSKAEDRVPVHAVAGISFEVERGHLFTLLGPSGCGKSTTLRCIAGLETPGAGVVVVGDRTMFSAPQGIDVPANQRGLGMVFQSYAIWPHMTVFENVAFPLQVTARRRRPKRREIAGRVERVLEVVQLQDIAARPATDLSGGQQQRLALARALVLEPPLLLLDEPLSNLDAQLRVDMRFELKRLQRELGVTTVYVTHDQVEALALADRIGVMHAGRLEQVGRPPDIYERPATEFVASFIGTTNLVRGRVGATSGSHRTVATPNGDLHVPHGPQLAAGSDVLVSIRPEHITLAPTDATHRNGTGWSGRVESRVYLGDAIDHVVRVGTTTLRVRSAATASLPPDTDVHVGFDLEHAAVIPDSG